MLAEFFFVEANEFHMGPGPHPDGTPQSIHGNRGDEVGSGTPSISKGAHHILKDVLRHDGQNLYKEEVLAKVNPKILPNKSAVLEALSELKDKGLATKDVKKKDGKLIIIWTKVKNSEELLKKFSDDSGSVKIKELTPYEANLKDMVGKTVFNKMSEEDIAKFKKGELKVEDLKSKYGIKKNKLKSMSKKEVGKNDFKIVKDENGNRKLVAYTGHIRKENAKILDSVDDSSINTSKRRVAVIHGERFVYSGEILEHRPEFEVKDYEKWSSEFKEEVKSKIKKGDDAFYAYQDGSYANINRVLRGKNISGDAEDKKECTRFAKILQNCFQKTKSSILKDDVTLYRGTKIPNISKIYEDYASGKTMSYSDKAFMSSTINLFKAKDWGKGNEESAFIEIRARKGMRVAPVQFGAHDNEREVLINAGQKFKIVGMSKFVKKNSHSSEYFGSYSYYIIIEPDIES